MQFSIPPHFDTWGHYGVDGNGDGVRNVYDAADAIPSAANLLAANGAAADLRGRSTSTTTRRLRGRRAGARGVVRRGGDRHARPGATAEDTALASDDETPASPPSPSGSPARSGRSVEDRSRSLSAVAAARDRYDADQIQVLEGLDPVRKRPGMYIGGTGRARAAPPRLGGRRQRRRRGAGRARCTGSCVEVDAEGVVTVDDDGRGIPVGTTRRPASRRSSSFHAPARRRQVRQRRLQGLGRPPRRRRVGDQRPVGVARGRGAPRRPPVAPALRAGGESATSRRSQAHARRGHGHDRRWRFDGGSSTAACTTRRPPSRRG